MDKIILVKPIKKYEQQVMKYKEDFIRNNQGFEGCSGLEKVETFDEWIKFDERNKIEHKENAVPADVFLGIRESDDKLVGIINTRYGLNDFLLKYGGHIGYCVAVDERRKGYAKEMLRLSLEVYKKLNIDRVLITCDKTNIGSYKTIMANGGVLENELEDIYNMGTSGIVQRYWINIE